MALILIMFAHLLIQGQLIPLHATASRWFWFGLSGIIGFSIGDTLLFRSFVLIGPRLSMLMMALAPIFGTIIAWIFLAEVLKPIQILAIIITLAGIACVIRERKSEDAEYKRDWTGLLCGVGAALGQALGLIISKKGLADGFPALSGNFIRVLFATVSLWIMTTIMGRVPSTFQRLSNKKAVALLSGGVLFGPFLGVWLSLIAVQQTYVGTASTLMALPPIILIPLSHWVFKEKISIGAIIGTIIALSGVVLIFLT